MTAVKAIEFARMMNVNRSTVSRYKRDGRLVFTGDGLVDVDASKRRLKETADPNRDDVVQRHIKAKGMEPEEIDEATEKYQESRAKKEKYLALQAKADYEKSIGELIKREQVELDWANVAEILRSSFERLPDMLSGELAAETDYNRVHAILVENIESILKEASEQIAIQ